MQHCYKNVIVKDMLLHSQASGMEGSAGSAAKVSVTPFPPPPPPSGLLLRQVLLVIYSLIYGEPGAATRSWTCSAYGNSETSMETQVVAINEGPVIDYEEVESLLTKNEMTAKLLADSFSKPKNQKVGFFCVDIAVSLIICP